jgi:DnaJ domain
MRGPWRGLHLPMTADRALNRSTMKTVYDMLGVAPDADDQAIGAAFRSCAKVYHPDICAGDQDAEEQFKLITAAHALVKSPERRAAYDRHLRLRRQQLRRQWKITVVGCSISAVISASLVGVIAPRFVKSPSARSNVEQSLLTKSPAYQLAPPVGTTTARTRPDAWAFTQMARDAAVDTLRTSRLAPAPSRADFAGTRAVETKAAISPEPNSLVVQAAGPATIVAVAPARTIPGRTSALVAGGDLEETSPADLSTCLAARPAERRLPADELASLRRRGKEFIANGVVAAARLVFQRAAEACDTDAAFALGATYDPIMLQKLGTRTLTPDIAMARVWYERARKLGSVEASAQLDLLAKANPQMQAN